MKGVGANNFNELLDLKKRRVLYIHIDIDKSEGEWPKLERK